MDESAESYYSSESVFEYCNETNPAKVIRYAPVDSDSVSPNNSTSQNGGCSQQSSSSSLLQSELLLAVANELAGNTEPNTNELLESEIKRYCRFLQEHSSEAEAVHKAQTKIERRVRILLNLQSDLIKIIDDADVLKRIYDNF